MISEVFLLRSFLYLWFVVMASLWGVGLWKESDFIVLLPIAFLMFFELSNNLMKLLFYFKRRCKARNG